MEIKRHMARKDLGWKKSSLDIQELCFDTERKNKNVFFRLSVLLRKRRATMRQSK